MKKQSQYKPSEPCPNSIVEESLKFDLAKKIKEISAHM